MAGNVDLVEILLEERLFCLTLLSAAHYSLIARQRRIPTFGKELSRRPGGASHCESCMSLPATISILAPSKDGIHPIRSCSVDHAGVVEADRQSQWMSLGVTSRMKIQILKIWLRALAVNALNILNQDVCHGFFTCTTKPQPRFAYCKRHLVGNICRQTLRNWQCYWRCTAVWPCCKVQAKRCWLWVSSLRCARYMITTFVPGYNSNVGSGQHGFCAGAFQPVLNWLAACGNRYRCDLRLCGLGITELVVKLREDRWQPKRSWKEKEVTG